MCFYRGNKILEFLINLEYPVSRGDKTVKEFLQDYYDQFIIDYKGILESKDDTVFSKDVCFNAFHKALPMVEETIRHILEVLDYYDEGKMTKERNSFNALMDRIAGQLYIRIIDSKDEYRNLFYRIRNEKCEERKDLFHIPLDKKHLIKAGRYSIQGFPCLYLSTYLTLCWFECGMPINFTYSAFRLSSDEIKLINFGSSPLELASWIDIQNKNGQSNDMIAATLIRYLITYPLQVACSIKVADHSVLFIEEYIIPQLLLLWVKENGKYDGILYKSSVNNDEVKKLGFFNVVLPAKRIKDGYCEHLNDLFLVSEPKYKQLGFYLESHGFVLDKHEKYMSPAEIDQAVRDVNFFRDNFYNLHYDDFEHIF